VAKGGKEGGTPASRRREKGEREKKKERKVAEIYLKSCHPARKRKMSRWGKERKRRREKQSVLLDHYFHSSCARGKGSSKISANKGERKESIAHLQ